MRLPTVTPEHERNETSREFHETLYQHFLDQTKHVIAVTPATVDVLQHTISGNLRQFWLARGFAVKTHRDPRHKFLWVWLRARPAKARRKNTCRTSAM